MIDWAATGSMIRAIAAWAGVAAVIYAAWRASNTIDGFRKEKLFEYRLETADDVFTLAYRIKRNLALNLMTRRFCRAKGACYD